MVIISLLSDGCHFYHFYHCEVLIQLGNIGIVHRMNLFRKSIGAKKMDCKLSSEPMYCAKEPRASTSGRVAGRFVGRFFDESSVLGDFLVGFLAGFDVLIVGDWCLLRSSAGFVVGLCWVSA